jgi:hypothetical protein
MDAEKLDFLDSNLDMVYLDMRKQHFPTVPKQVSGSDGDALRSHDVHLKQWQMQGSSPLSKVYVAHNSDGDPCVVRLFPKKYLLEHDKIKMVHQYVGSHKLVEGHPNILSLQQVPISQR